MAPSWTEILTLYGEHGGFGELRDPIDWTRLPLDHPLRAVYLVDEVGPVVRWLLPEDAAVTGALGGIYHDHLERGDGHGRALSGWITVSEDSVMVSP